MKTAVLEQCAQTADLVWATEDLIGGSFFTGGDYTGFPKTLGAHSTPSPDLTQGGSGLTTQAIRLPKGLLGRKMSFSCDDCWCEPNHQGLICSRSEPPRLNPVC